MTGRRLCAWILAGALLGLWLSPGRGYAAPDHSAARYGQIERADRPGAGRVSYVESIGRRGYVVEMSNGAVYRLRVCRHEDSRRCLWDSTRRGNGRGRSFAALPGGRVVTVPARLMRRAYR